MCAIGGISFIAGLVFLIAGAWPVMGFFGLDVLLVYWAFKANYRSARAYETVTVTSSDIVVRKVGQRGAVTEMSFNPLWVTARARGRSGIQCRKTLSRVARQKIRHCRLFVAEGKRRLHERAAGCVE